MTKTGMAPAPHRKVTRLFIANRGEIARRIALTARRLGVESVALSDRAVPPAYLTDAVTIVVKVSEESPALYLDAEAMLRHAQDGGCDAVHPGFGFLSENAGFAAAVERAGLTWIGPSPAAITAMASKATARSHAETAKVPVVRGLNGFDRQGLEAFAGEVGFPLLLKAAMGGGGKGMRVVTKTSELAEAMQRAASEAKSSFGDGALICEQYLTAPRHVEVQILADRHGRVAAIGDRDCSLQRRHQKIIEEAPAPALTPATRAALHDAARRLAAAVGYDSTGTVEFLVDWSPASRDAAVHRFYFLEMNTRLQVEHPVTEEVFGLDLVEWQLRVARGEALPEVFLTLAPRGHSVEARLYAEDPRHGFFPAPGPVAAFKPALGPGVRWELGLDPVDEITGRFDPMVAKLVATAATREGALARLADALARTVFAGPPANLDLLRELALRSAFAEGPVTTHYLGEALPGLLTAIDARLARDAALGAELLDALAAGRLGGKAPVRGADFGARTQAIFAGGGHAPAPSAAAGPPGAGAPPGGASRAHVAVALTSYDEAPAGRLAATSGTGLVRGAPSARAKPFWYASLHRGGERWLWVCVDGSLYQRQTGGARDQRAARRVGGLAKEILAPVPGKVIAVKATAGAKLEAGDTVLVLESMKMEFEVKAAQAGTLASIDVKASDQVTAGQRLAQWSQ